MTINQQALHVDCGHASHDMVSIQSPHFVGPVEYAWSIRDNNDPTVFGVGPLAGTCVPGASGLVLAGRSMLWDGFHCSVVAGGGLTLAALPASLLALRGRAPQPSVLWIVEREPGRLDVRLEPLDPEPLWQGTHDGEGVVALLQHLAHQQWDSSANLQVLAVGPAAARTRFGSLCSARWENAQPIPIRGWFRHAGPGSRLFQVHHLCGIVIGASRSSGELRDELEEGGLLKGFQPEMTVEELSSLVRYEFNPRLLGLGALGASLSAVRQRLLWFNGTSVHLTSQQRDDLYHRNLRDHYIRRLADGHADATHHTCGESCPIVCKTIVHGRQREADPCIAFGPQIGVVDADAVDSVAAHCDSLGFDSLSAGAAIAWLMERLHRHLMEPGFLGLSGQPAWDADTFDAAPDSAHNARLARGLADGMLFAPWAQSLRQGLREGARAAGGSSTPLAIYNANGDRGEMAIQPCWTPGFFTPMPIPGEHHQYYGMDFVPPRVLGRKSARRMVAELTLQNFGFCRLHRGWAEEQVSDLINRHLRSSVDWAAHHRDLAKRIFRRRKARFWETGRIIDVIASYLQDYEHDAAPDAELDRWVRRFREDRASAARAYWSEINAGLEEILGS